MSPWHGKWPMRRIGTGNEILARGGRRPERDAVGGDEGEAGGDGDVGGGEERPGEGVEA